MCELMTHFSVREPVASKADSVHKQKFTEGGFTCRDRQRSTSSKATVYEIKCRFWSASTSNLSSLAASIRCTDPEGKSLQAVYPFPANLERHQRLRRNIIKCTYKPFP